MIDWSYTLQEATTDVSSSSKSAYWAHNDENTGYKWVVDVAPANGFYGNWDWNTSRIRVDVQDIYKRGYSDGQSYSTSASVTQYFHHHRTDTNSYSDTSVGGGIYSDDYISSYSGGCFTKYESKVCDGIQYVYGNGDKSTWAGGDIWWICDKCGNTNAMGWDWVQTHKSECVPRRCGRELGAGYTRTCGRVEGELVRSEYN